VVATDEFERAEYRANDGRRCFHCKSALMKAMDGLARATAAGRGDTALLIGAIADDFADVRPGLQAAAEAGARWPLADAGLTKDEIRARSRARGLATWDRPAEPCLSSRIPYGEPVTPEAVRMVEAAEACLRRLGLRDCRARHHRVGAKADGSPRGWLCRIEVPDGDLAAVVAGRGELVAALKRVGYAHVALDLVGLVSGGFNRLLSDGERAAASAPGPA
jgi:pyridinium-3,5-biscarboxylic acid mononucleotide sulfurtransferase